MVNANQFVVSLPTTLEDIERQAIRTALAMTNGVQKDAAKLLGISPRVIGYKIKMLGLRQDWMTKLREDACG